jgi:hypothetical protein
MPCPRYSKAHLDLKARDLKGSVKSIESGQVEEVAAWEERGSEDNNYTISRMFP